jgi:RHS repeat-associated protein
VGLPAGWQGLAKNWADLNSNNQVQTRREYLDAVDAVFARIAADGTEAWYLTDHLGSVRGLMNNSGTLIDGITFDAWGNVTNETAPGSGDQMKFAGGWVEGNIGLGNFGARWYDLLESRWITQDPKGLGPDLNSYRYVGNDPPAWTDPTGLIMGREKEKGPLQKPPHLDPNFPKIPPELRFRLPIGIGLKIDPKSGLFIPVQVTPLKLPTIRKPIIILLPGQNGLPTIIKIPGTLPSFRPPSLGDYWFRPDYVYEYWKNRRLNILTEPSKLPYNYRKKNPYSGVPEINIPIIDIHR